MTIGTHHDRQGNKITVQEWEFLMRSNDYRRVAQSRVDGVIVSTVWDGWNHNWGEGPPLIFETKVFGGGLHEQRRRWCTEEQAAAGHREMVDLVRLDQSLGRD